MLDLRTARELAGLSQDALAEETGITPVTITHLENGHHKPQKRTREVMEVYFGHELLWNSKSTRAMPMERNAASMSRRQAETNSTLDSMEE